MMNKPMENKPRNLDQVRDKLRLKHYSYRTEQSYIVWIKRFIFFHSKRHPDTMGKKEIESFLSYLVVKRNVAASTQNQALCALLFLYKEVLGRKLAWLESMQRPKRPARLPVVLTALEVQKLLNKLQGRSC
ncbi:Phage integrase, N-terminal SAM-like domain [Nitrosomonas sp. Nm166]|nr:Phage integrase, N-terminal SAM-like domain [Nitrosomonas sp. Nm166]